jgi:hypothetical protein
MKSVLGASRRVVGIRFHYVWVRRCKLHRHWLAGDSFCAELCICLDTTGTNPAIGRVNLTLSVGNDRESLTLRISVGCEFSDTSSQHQL